MALLDSEVIRIKRALGYPLLTNSAAPYVGGFYSLFDQVIAVYVQSGAKTTCTTEVSAATSATPVVLTLASVTGIAVYDRIVLDVDTRQERPTVQSISGSTVTVLLTLAHAGSYPVSVEGGESIVRDILRELANIDTTISSLRNRVGLKKAGEEIEFFGGGGTLASQGLDQLTQVLTLREQWRDELASALGVNRLNAPGAGGGSTLSVY